MPRIGRYELLRLLGRGGMAEVFLARRRGPGGVEKQLALKRIRPERSGDPRFLEMFVTEARLSMSMAHKNIVQVFDFGRAGEQLFLVMEYIDGVDLGTALAALRAHRSGRRHVTQSEQSASRTLDPLLAAFIGMEACQALDYAFRTGEQSGQAIVHRDVTPRNVLLSRAGEIKLVDFGVATAVTDLGRAGRVRGTPAYMSPEQARGQPVDGRSDVFSLGLVLWEALAGRRAYPGDEPRLVLDIARAAEVPALDDEIPGELRDIVTRATARDPDDRFADARAMQLALDGFVINARVSARASAQAGGEDSDRGEPPSHRIAAWVEEVARDLAEGEREIPAHSGDLDAADGTPPGSGAEVVTFLDDGEEVAESLGVSMVATLGDTGALQAIMSDPDSESMIATLGDTGAVAAIVSETETETETGTESETETETETESETPPRSRSWFLGGVIAFAVLGLGLWALQTRSTDAPLALDAGSPVVTSTVAIDASPGPSHARPDAAPTAIETPDASPTALLPDAAPEQPARPITTRKNPRVPPGPTSTRPGNDTGKPSGAPGTVKISATPWAQVTVSNHPARCDETPCELTLPAGRHILRLVNPVADLRKDVTVTVVAGKTIVVNTRLTASE